MSKKKKITAFKITKKMEKDHKKMLETNMAIIADKWKALVDEAADLGGTIQPTIAPAPMPGMWASLIQVKPMSIEDYDRHKNPEKWAERDLAERERVQKLQDAKSEMAQEINEIVEKVEEDQKNK